MPTMIRLRESSWGKDRTAALRGRTSDRRFHLCGSESPVHRDPLRQSRKPILSARCDWEVCSWTGTEGHRVDRTFPDGDRANHCILAGDGFRQLAMKPLRDVFRGWFDGVEWWDVVDASVVELLGERFQLLSRTDEIDSDCIGVNTAGESGQVRFHFVRMAMQGFGDAAIFAKKVCGLESRLDADAEVSRRGAEDALDHDVAHAKLAQLLRIGLRPQKRFRTRIVPAVSRIARFGQRDQCLQRLAAVCIHAVKCTMRAATHASAQENPLPRSLY